MSLYQFNPEKLRYVMSVDEASNLVGMSADTIRKAGRRYVVPKKPLHDMLGIKEG
ncbi:MerR family transcriptional regulator [Corynebacterium stationis]|uniref:Helix-turn-helix domain-containing protein n=1 Tax=Corynebacterium stationis TaxID=1705 RepID=A0AB36CL23_9CORY|nr:hypothetical protein [Corynebacterium stationis]NME89580.1 hypothetical protein [Corynebacterium stationis]